MSSYRGAKGSAKLSVTLLQGLKYIKDGLLGVLGISAKGESGSIWLPWIDLLLRFWQMLSFVTDASLGVSWPPAVSPLEVVGAFTNLRGFLAYFPSANFSSGTYYGALGWVAVLVSLLAWGVWHYPRGPMPLIWPLKLLRIMANLSVGFLFIPLLQLLLSPIAQGLSGGDDGTTTVPRIAVGVVLSLSLIFLALLFASVFYDSSSLSRNPEACAHGRVNVIMLLVKLVATIVGGRVIPGLSVAFVSSVLALCGGVWLGSYLYFMPSYRHVMNAANVGCATAFLWAVGCLVVNNSYRATDAALMLWTGLPFTFLTGVYAATGRAGSIIARPVAQLVTPLEVELQNRYLLHAALWGHHFYRLPESVGGGGAGNNPALAALLVQDASAGAGGDAHSRATLLKEAVPPELLARVLASYRSAVARFPDSAIIHIFLARFYAEWHGNRHMMLSHFSQAERRAPAIDLAFVIYQGRREMDGEGGGGRGEEGKGGREGGALTSINRLTFEKATADARFHVQLSSAKNLAFWTELVEAQPDLAKLHRLSAEMNASIALAELAFSGALELLPQSVFVLRLYAAFNEHVLVNADKAEVLLAEAERVEEAASKEHRTEGSTQLSFGEETTMELWTEATAYLTVSASARDVGTILPNSVNAAACKLFGLSRLQLERRSVFSLLPPPLGAHYEASLRSHAVSGEGNIVNFTRLSFVLGPSGAMVPVVAAFKDAPADDGPPALLFIVRELLATTVNCILLDTKGAILGVTPGSLALLDLAPATLRSREARIQAYVEEWGLQGVREELLSPGGSVLRVDVKLAIEDGEEEYGDEGGDGGYRSDEGEDGEEGGTPGSSRRNFAVSNKTAAAAAAATYATTSFSNPSHQVRSTWIRAHLQPLRVLGEERAGGGKGEGGKGGAGGGPKAFVLHWSRLPTSDATLLYRASLKRDAALGKTQQEQGQQQQQQPLQSVAGQAHTQPSPGFPPPAGTAAATTPSLKPPMSWSVGSRATSRKLTTFADEGGEGGKGEGGEDERDGVFGSDFNAAESALFAMDPHPPPPPNPPPPNSSTTPGGMAGLPALLLGQGSGFEASIGGSRRGRLSSPSPLSSSNTRRGGGGSAKGKAGSSSSSSRSGSEGTGGEGSSRSGSGAGGGSRTLGGGDDRSSATSDSLTRVGRTMARLRRVLSSDSAVLMPGLWWLKQAGRALVLFAIGLTAALVLVTRASFLSAYNNILYVHTASDAMYYKGAAIVAAQNLMLAGRGWLPLAPSGIAKERATILSATRKFVEFEDLLFSLAQASGNTPAFTTRYLTLTRFDIPANSLSGNLKVLNAREVVADFATTMQAIAALNMSDFAAFSDGSAKGHPLLASLNTNYMRGGNGHDGLLYTGDLGYVSTLSTQRDIQTTQNVVFGSMTGVLGLLGVLVFLPILAHVDRTGDSIMAQFVALPLPVRKGLFAQANRRMLMLRRFTRDDEDGDDGQGDDLPGEEGGVALDFDGAARPSNAAALGTAVPLQQPAAGVGGAAGFPPSTGPLPQPSASSSSSSSLPVVGEDGSVNWDSVLAAGLADKGKEARRRLRGEASVYRKSSTSFIILVLRFLAPLIILEVLFVAVYVTFETTSSTALALTSVSAAANNRASCGRQALADLIKLQYLETDSAYVQASYYAVFEGVACVRDNTALLAYGTVPATLNKPYTPYTPTVENGGASVLTPEATATVYGAMFGDACAFLALKSTYAFDTAACKAFSSGVVTLGLAPLVAAWASRFELLADAKLRTQYTSDGLGNGTGFITSSDLFNYSSVACAGAMSEAAKLALGCTTVFSAITYIPSGGGAVPAAPLSNPTYSGLNVSTLINGTAPAGSTPYSIAAAFASAEYAWLLEDATFLTPGLRAVSSIYDAEASSVILNYISFLINFSACWLTFFTLIIFFYFVPGVNAKNSDIHTTRSMLLYLPVPVVSRIKSILALVEDILAKHSDQLTSVGGGKGGAGGSRAQVAPMG